MIELDEVAPESREEVVLKHVEELAPGSLLEGSSPYTWACEIPSLRLARLVAEMNFDVNARGEDGSTALTWAPNYEFTKLFVDLGAKVSQEMHEDGVTSLHRAAQAGRTDQLRLLLTDTDGVSCLEQFDQFGRSPLAVASHFGRFDAVKVLLDAGANPNAYNADYLGWNVLQAALLAGHVEIARLLIESGADPGYFEGLTKSPEDIAREQLIYEALQDLFSSNGRLMELNPKD